MAGPPPLRAALVGYGLAGRWFHAPLVRGTPGLRLTTVVTADPQRRAAAVADLGEVRLLSSPEALWDLAGEHDLVVVATPNRFHHPLSHAALEAGLDVVVDKPMAPTAAEARDLAATARSRGRTLAVFHNRRWDAEILTLQRVLAEGALGDVVRVESRFERWRPEVGRGWRESPDPADAGGVLMDLGSHLVDQAMHLFGRPVAVTAEIAARRPGAAVDDDVFVALSFPSGPPVHLWASLVAAAPAARLRVLGTRAAFVRDRLDVQEDALRAGRRPVAGRRWGVERRSMWPRLVDGSGEHPITGAPGAWPRFYAELVTALRGEGRTPVTADEGVAVLDVIEAARHSALANVPVALDVAD